MTACRGTRLTPPTVAAGPGAVAIAQGTLDGKDVANTFKVTIGGAPGLVAGNNYVLAVGAQLQNADQRRNGFPNPAQPANINNGVYTFIV